MGQTCGPQYNFLPGHGLTPDCVTTMHVHNYLPPVQICIHNFLTTIIHTIIHSGALGQHLKKHSGEKHNKWNQCEYASTREEKSQTDAINASRHLYRHLIWGCIWRCTADKSQRNATNAIMHPPMQEILGGVWRRTADTFIVEFDGWQSKISLCSVPGKLSQVRFCPGALLHSYLTKICAFDSIFTFVFRVKQMVVKSHHFYVFWYTIIAVKRITG